MGGLGHGPLQPAPQRGHGMEMPFRLPCPLLWFLFQGWVLLINKCAIRSLKDGTTVSHGELQTVLELTWEEVVQDGNTQMCISSIMDKTVIDRIKPVI